MKKKIQFDVITVLPEVFGEYLGASMMWKAQKEKKAIFKIHNLRDFTSDKRKTVDDTPYGGGAGMILKVEPIYKALQKIKKTRKQQKKIRTILFSASGKRLTQQDLYRLAEYDQLVMVCGRYEGVDERVMEFIDEEISIGDFVLTGGELPAMTVIDGVTRLIPGVLGNKESLKEESHSLEGQLEYPQYTKPEIFSIKQPNKKTKKQKVIELRVPEILRSGNHKLISEWREKHRKK